MAVVRVAAVIHAIGAALDAVEAEESIAREVPA